MRTHGPFPCNDGIWNLANRSIIQILLNVGKRKMMEVFRRNLPVNLIRLEKERELSFLTWGGPGPRSQGIALKEGCLGVPAEKVHAPQMTEAIVFLLFEISVQRHGYFFLFLS